MQLLVLATLLAVASARPALIFPVNTIGIEYADVEPGVISHPAVEENAANEALLPREYQKSRDFYDNPVIAAALAQESWFTEKEMRVVERDSEKIPREEIYKIVKHAGFLDN